MSGAGVLRIRKGTGCFEQMEASSKERTEPSEIL